MLVPDLVARARAEKADAILVSQVVTQKDAHLRNTRELADAVRAASWPCRTARVVCRAAPQRSASAADVLPEPVLVVRANATVVVP